VSNYSTAPQYLGYNPASTSGGPNFLGGGMYQGAPIQINAGAYNNPLASTAVPLGNQQLTNYLGATTAPVTAATNPAFASGIGGQQNVASQYQNLANGVGPSAATVAAQQQGAANLSAAESMLGSARGAGNPAAAQLAARNAQTTGAQQVAQNVVAGRTNEELGALGALGGIYGNIAGQGLTAQGQANQVAQGNQANTLAANTNYLGALTGIAGQQQQGAENAQNTYASTALGQEGIANSAYQAAAANNNKILQQGLQLGGTAASGLFGAL
jgi:hypothetical protein